MNKTNVTLKKIVLGDLIRHLDKMSWLKLVNGAKEEEDILFSGFVMDTPWIYLDYELMTTDDWEAIGAEAHINENDVKIDGFVIYVKEIEVEYD